MSDAWCCMLQLCVVTFASWGMCVWWWWEGACLVDFAFLGSEGGVTWVKPA